MPGRDGRNSFISKLCAGNNAISFGDGEYGARRRMAYDVPKNMDVPVAILKSNVASPDVTIGPEIAISISYAVTSVINALARSNNGACNDDHTASPMATAAAKPYVSCPATISTTSRSAADYSHVVLVVVLVGAAAEAV